MADARFPNLFIVGAAKCGTTTLYAQLASHPAIFMSPLKEPHHFAADLQFPDTRVDSVETYLSLFSPASESVYRYRGEASVSYLLSETAARNISSVRPDARILVCLRNPIEAIGALHAFAVVEGLEPIHDLAHALALESQRRNESLSSGRSWVLSEFLLYRRCVDFATQIARYLAVFPRSQVHVVLLEDMALAPGETLEQLFEFLRLPCRGVPVTRHDNLARKPRIWSLNRIMYHPPERLAATWRFLVPRPARRVLSDSLASWNTRQAPRPAVPDEVATPLRVELTPMVRELEGMLGRDLSGVWGF